MDLSMVKVFNFILIFFLLSKIIKVFKMFIFISTHIYINRLCQVITFYYKINCVLFLFMTILIYIQYGVLINYKTYDSSI